MNSNYLVNCDNLPMNRDSSLHIPYNYGRYAPQGGMKKEITYRCF